MMSEFADEIFFQDVCTGLVFAGCHYLVLTLMRRQTMAHYRDSCKVAQDRKLNDDDVSTTDESFTDVSLDNDADNDECCAVAPTHEGFHSSAGLALLEQYGVFGVPAGSWVEKSVIAQGEIDTTNDDASTDAGSDDVCHDETDEVERESLALSPRGNRCNDGLALLEHYGLFGVPAGVWDGTYMEKNDLPAGRDLSSVSMTGRQLLDHYGVFGAPPGVWS